MARGGPPYGSQARSGSSSPSQLRKLPCTTRWSEAVPSTSSHSPSWSGSSITGSPAELEPASPMAEDPGVQATRQIPNSSVTIAAFQRQPALSLHPIRLAHPLLPNRQCIVMGPARQLQEDVFQVRLLRFQVDDRQAGAG